VDDGGSGPSGVARFPGLDHKGNLMRHTFSVLSIVVGGALALLGLAAAVAIGPDDVGTLPPTTVSSSGARTALTAPDLFPYRNVTVQVSARNAGGTVFVGVANPVDVGSYLRDVTRLRVTEVGTGGELSGETKEGSRTEPSVAPETTTFWDDSESGTGTRRLDVRLTGDPATVAVVAGPTGGTLTMSLGVVVPHGFVAAVTTAAVGLAVVVAAVVLRRRGPRRPAGSVAPGQPDTTAATASAPTGAGPTSVGLSRSVPARTAWSTTGRSPARDRTRLAALGLVVATAVAGCASLPERVGTASATPVRTAVTDDEVLPAFASYDERNNAAIALSDQAHDPSGWESADSGAVLRADVFSTLLAGARGETEEPVVLTTAPLQVYAPAFDTYPMWFMATTTASSGTGDDPDDTVDLRVLERGSVLDPWRVAAATGIPQDAAPRPLTGGRPSIATPSQQAAAVDAMTAVQTYAETGDAGTLVLGEDLPAFRSDVTAVPGDIATLTHFDVRLLGDSADPTGPRGAVRVAAVDGGALASISFDYEKTVTASPGKTLHLEDEALAEVIGQQGDLEDVTAFGVLMVAVMLPDDGPPTVLGAWASTTAP